MGNLVNSTIDLAPTSMGDAFPDVDPGRRPLGARVIVQLRRTKKRTRGGLVVVESTREDQKWNCQVGKVVALGPLAFCNRETGKPWPEGAWANVGEFVVVPRWGGNRHEVDILGEDEPVVFVTWNDHELIGVITTDPLNVRDYLI